MGFEGLEQLTGEVVDGQLVLYGPKENVLGARTVSITPAPHPSANWPEVFALAGAGVFLLLSLVALFIVAAHRDQDRGYGELLAGSAPGPGWTFDGWSGRLAAVGGLLAVVLGQIGLPAIPREVSKETLVQLNVIFLAMLAVGPFIFYALRRRTLRDSWPATWTVRDLQEKGIWGVKCWLLLSYVITAVAVTGQIGALTLLGTEIIADDSWRRVAIGIGVLLTALAWWSFALAAHEQLHADWDKQATVVAPTGEQPLKLKHQPIWITGEPRPTGVTETSPGDEATPSRPVHSPN